MLFQLIGCVIVTGATAKIGFDCSASFTQRTKELADIKKGLIYIKNEIKFNCPVIHIAMKKASESMNTSAGEIFYYTAENILNNPSKTALWAWEKAVDKALVKLSITQNDADIIKEYGVLLGRSTVSAETDNIDFTIERLKECEEEATKNEKKYKGFCKTAGIWAGIIISVLFV